MESHLFQDQLFSYGFEAFKEKLFKLNDKQTSIVEIDLKKHLMYLNKYLKENKVTHYFIEKEYINKDYLTNFSSYYCTCFKDYKIKSSRIHFFREDIKQNEDKVPFEETLTKIFLDNTLSEPLINDFFKNSYIGYIVINPIPNLFLGYTLLKHYNCFSYDENRIYWGTKKYNVHLFGHLINIDSLAFHEQDQNVGACATASIWAVFQKASEDYYVNLKSQIEITKDAGLINYNGQRILPNNGLVPEGICSAICKNNLEPEIRDLSEYSNINNPNKYLKRIVYAYSSIGIPLILCLEVPDEGILYGHAVSICGHKIDKNLKIGKCENDYISKADYISKLFFHDDQWGPYVSASFLNENDFKFTKKSFYLRKNNDNVRDKVKFKFIKNQLLDTIWTEYTDGKTFEKLFLKKMEKGSFKMFSKVNNIIIPVFPKIRISFDSIDKKIFAYSSFFRNLIILEDITSWSYCNWDIRLWFSNEFKADFKKFKPDSPIEKEEENNFYYKLLSQNFPKYIWVATMSFGEKKYVTLIYDATGLVNTNLLLNIIFYTPNIKNEILTTFKIINENNKEIENFVSTYSEITNCDENKYIFL